MASPLTATTVATFLLLSLVAGSAIPARRLQQPTAHETPLPLLIGSQPTFLRPAKPDSTSNVVSSTLSQPTDHFSTSGSTTFSQRYFSNDQYVNGSQVHFLYVEGGQEVDSSKIGDPTMPIVALASKVGAKLWLLEHRFYGQSRPFT